MRKLGSLGYNLVKLREHSISRHKKSERHNYRERIEQYRA